MILEEAPGQGHFVGCLDQSCTEVPQALVFIFVHYVEWRRQKLLTEVLGRGEMSTDLADRLVDKALVIRNLGAVRVLIIDHLLLNLELLEHLVNTSHLLHHVLVLHLLLWLCVLHVVPVSLRQNTALDLELLPLLLQSLLMIVGNEHSCLPPLLIEESPDSSLDFDSG